MKYLICIFIMFSISLSWGQVGIGTTTPQETLEVQGTVRFVDGNQQKDGILVSDVNGTGTWTNVNDGVRTRIIRVTGSTTPTIWSHPEGIDVTFDTSSKRVTVTNNSGNNTDYWDIVIEGDARTASGTSGGTSRYIKHFRLTGQSIYLDLGNGSITSGWFNILAVKQSNESDGFTMNIIYYGTTFNGMVQYWDE